MRKILFTAVLALVGCASQQKQKEESWKFIVNDGKIEMVEVDNISAVDSSGKQNAYRFIRYFNSGGWEIATCEYRGGDRVSVTAREENGHTVPMWLHYYYTETKLLSSWHREEADPILQRIATYCLEAGRDKFKQARITPQIPQHNN